MHSSSEKTGDFPLVFYFSLAFVILGAAIFQCAPVFTHVFRANRTTGDTRSTDKNSNTGSGHSQVDPSWTATNLILRCTYVLSLLLAIGLVIFTGLLLGLKSQSDQRRFQAVLLTLLVSIPRVHIIYESQLLRLTKDSYRYAVWVGWGYCVVLLVVLSSLIESDIHQAIPSKISLAFSFVEYLITASGHTAIYRKLYQPRWRLLVLFYASIISCILAGFTALILLIFDFVADTDVVLIQSAYATVTSLCLLRFLVFYYARSGDAVHSATYATWDSQTTSQAELVDFGGGKTRVDPEPAFEHPTWSQVAAYGKTIHWGAINDL